MNNPDKRSFAGALRNLQLCTAATRSVVCIATMLCMAVLSSCSGAQAIYDETESAKAWNCDSAICFTPTITDDIDTTALYRTGILIRNSGRYEYQNLWLFVDVVRPDGTTHTDTLEYYLADDYGNWIGTSSIGSLYTITYLYEDSLCLAHGTHTYSIRHGMRLDELNNITDIGLRIEKINKQ